MIEKHTHKLKRKKYKTGNTIYFCTLPDCHYKIEVELALGKKSICNICGDEFIINEYTLRLAKPHCTNCGKVKVRNSDGRNYYVHKTPNKITESIASNSIENLRNRLIGSVVQIDNDNI